MAEVLRKYNRDSNIELLRLICMFFIVMHHFMIRCVAPDTFDADAGLSSSRSLSLIINGFLSVGVNCFVLISGFYLIRLRLKSVLNLYIACAFYGLLGYFVYNFVEHVSIGGGILWNSLFVFSHSGWWFINCYLGLMLLTPILNICIEQVEKKTFQVILLCLTVANVYFGYFWQTGCFNNTGYTIAQFVYIYMIGAYINRFLSFEKIRQYRYLSLGVYMLCSIVWAVLAIINVKYPFGYIDYVYNNPLVIIGAIAFFCFFLSMHFNSKLINWLSAGVLSAYLIQDHPLLRKYTYDGLKTIIDALEWSVGFQIGVFCGISVVFILACSVFDKLRQNMQKRLFEMSSITSTNKK